MNTGRMHPLLKMRREWSHCLQPAWLEPSMQKNKIEPSDALLDIIWHQRLRLQAFLDFDAAGTGKNSQNN